MQSRRQTYAHLIVHSDDRDRHDDTLRDLGTNKISLTFQQGHDAQGKLKSVGLNTFTMPNHIYNVSDAVHPRKGPMNTVVILTQASSLIVGTVPPGWYTISTLLDSLNVGGTTVWTGLQGDNTITFSQDAVSKIVSCTIAGTGDDAGTGFVLQSNSFLDGGVIRTARQWVPHLLGFHGANGLYATTQVAVRLPNLIPFQHLYVCYNNLRTSLVVSQENAGNMRYALACIPISVPFGELIVYENHTPTLFNTSDGTELLNNIELSLLDDEGCLLQSNNAKWEATLTGFIG